MFTSKMRPLLAKSKRAMMYRAVLDSGFLNPNSLSKMLVSQHSLVNSNQRLFSSKNDKPEKEDSIGKSEKKKNEKDDELSAEGTAEVAESGRNTWFNTKQKMVSKLILKQNTPTEENPDVEEAKLEQEELYEGKPVHRLYTIKFNSPILPYSKFPLTQNKYIQQFFKRYAKDKDKIDKLIGVYFLENKNSEAPGSIGIEVELDTSSPTNMSVVESKNFKRYKVIDLKDNFCRAIEFEDRLYGVKNSEGEKVKMSMPDILASEDLPDKSIFEDLINSEITDLKNTWFQFNKRMNSSLMVLPSEMLNTYDMVVKTLPVPNFEMYRFRNDASLYELFNQITCKMAHYYFSLFQALFSKDQKDMKIQMRRFLECDDPVMRSKKVMYLFDEFTTLLDRKCHYIQKTAEEFKERSKQAMLEGAFQRVLEDNKTSDKENFQKMLDDVKDMPDRIRKVIQDEVNGLEAKADMDSARKVQYLQHVFKLPWDSRVDAFWDVQHARKTLEDSHYGMVETKERILEFVAKNKRANSRKGMVLLLTGPPGVGKTTIAHSVGECLKRPTAVVSMAGQNDPVHMKGSKRTYVDSQPGIFVKELQRLGVRNPVLIIDEIDKIGFNSLRGDPSSTLLELLNPEQANTFSDNYLDFEFDFSE